MCKCAGVQGSTYLTLRRDIYWGSGLSFSVRFNKPPIDDTPIVQLWANKNDKNPEQYLCVLSVGAMGEDLQDIPCFKAFLFQVLLRRMKARFSSCTAPRKLVFFFERNGSPFTFNIRLSMDPLPPWKSNKSPLFWVELKTTVVCPVSKYVDTKLDLAIVYGQIKEFIGHLNIVHIQRLLAVVPSRVSSFLL